MITPEDNNILDQLLDNKNTEIDDVSLPRRCSLCKNPPICSVLPVLIEFASRGIVTTVEECYYHAPIKTQ